ncbi:MAG: hypothetical protein LBB75_00690, partial [Oscillospiraceae bacterium]|nr:hypothetical protein [Oscillospiraceae bacterium]
MVHPVDVGRPVGGGLLLEPDGDVFGVQAGAPEAPASGPLGCIDWEFIKAIATIRLYLEEQWIEPIAPPGQS